MRKKLCLLTVLVLALAAMPAASAQEPPTQEETKAAIEQGVDWLAHHQRPDGSWYLGNDTCSLTGLAVKKLMHQAVDPVWGFGLGSPFDPEYPYREHVEKGLRYLLTACARPIGIALQPAGDPDSDGDGLGVFFGTYARHRTYSSGIALMAMCEVVEFDRVVDVGPLAGWTYGDVARDLMDYLAFGQNDGGSGRGAWGYYENYSGWSDNSNSGYATLGLGFAEAAPPLGCGFEVPQFVKDELNIWIDYIQNDVNGDTYDGGSGYSHPNSWVNILKTGNLLQQMALVGDTADSARVTDALDYLERHWDDPNQDPGWRGTPTNYQATFAAMKGLTSLAIGEFGTAPIDWVADFETALLDEQLADGSWPRTRYDYGDRTLSTVWALLTLQRVAPPGFIPVPVDIKPTSCRNPFNVGKKGVMPVAILGTEDFNVYEIDPATVMLIGPDGDVYPLRWAHEDVATPYEPYLGKEGAYDCTEEGPDGYMDLTFKFDAMEVSAALGEVFDGDVLVLPLTGNLMEEFGGTPIVGEDVIVILKKK